MEPSRARRLALETGVLLASLMTSSLVALSLGQNQSWDQRNYHFYSGYALLHKPFHFDFAPAQVQTFFNPIFQVPAYLMLEHLPGRVTAALLGAIQGLNIWLVYRISKALLTRIGALPREVLSLACAATAFYGAVNLSELGTTFGDNTISVLLLVAVWLVIRYLNHSRTAEREGLTGLAAAGLISGLALGLKLTVSVYVIPLVIAFSAVTLVSRRRIRPATLLCAGILAGFLVSYGFWGLSLYREYRNPFFPYFNHIFRSRYYDPENTMDPRFMPRTWQQSLLYPFYFARRNTLVSEPEFRDVRLAACYVLVLLLVAAICRDRFRRSGPIKAGNSESADSEGRALLAVFLASSYVLWQGLFSIYRYTAVLEFLAPVFITLAWLRLIRDWRPAAGAALLTNAAVCLWLLPLDFGRQSFADGYLRVQPPSWEHLDESLVLMGGEEPTAYIIPSFPASTRFVRVVSNFIYPGRNAALDDRIRSRLAQYEPDRTLAYVCNLDELQTTGPALLYYGVVVDKSSCVALKSDSGDDGYLCRTRRDAVSLPEQRTQSEKTGSLPAVPLGDAVVFIDRPEVRLEVTPAIARINKDTFLFRVFHLDARAIDLLYSIDGELMPPLRNWSLDASGKATVFVSAATRTGLYHIIGVRASGAPASNEWVRVDVQARVR